MWDEHSRYCSLPASIAATVRQIQQPTHNTRVVTFRPPYKAINFSRSLCLIERTCLYNVLVQNNSPWGWLRLRIRMNREDICNYFRCSRVHAQKGNWCSTWPKHAKYPKYPYRKMNMVSGSRLHCIFVIQGWLGYDVA